MKNSTNGFLKESNAAAESENQYQRGHLHWNSNHRCDSPLYVFVWFNQYLCACAEKINLATWVVRAECLAELSQLNCLWFHCSVDRNKPWPDTRRCVCLHSSLISPHCDPNGNTPTMLPDALPALKFLKALRSSADSVDWSYLFVLACVFVGCSCLHAHIVSVHYTVRLCLRLLVMFYSVFFKMYVGLTCWLQTQRWPWLFLFIEGHFWLMSSYTVNLNKATFRRAVW